MNIVQFLFFVEPQGLSMFIMATTDIFLSQGLYVKWNIGIGRDRNKSLRHLLFIDYLLKLWF